MAKKAHHHLIRTMILAVAFVSCSALAAGPDEEIPQSRFGAPVAQPKLGVTPGYAMRAVEEQEATDLDVGAPKRKTLTQRNLASAPEASAPTTTTEQNADDIAQQMVQRGVQEISVIASDLGYFPKTLFVSRDVPVRMYITSASKNTLCIMMDSFQVRRQVRSQRIEEINFIPGVPGKYRFYCPVNGMEGTLIVKEFSSRQQ